MNQFQPSLLDGLLIIVWLFMNRYQSVQTLSGSNWARFIVNDINFRDVRAHSDLLQSIAFRCEFLLIFYLE